MEMAKQKLTFVLPFPFFCFDPYFHSTGARQVDNDNEV
jgi:hypothetical protein